MPIPLLGVVIATAGSLAVAKILDSLNNEDPGPGDGGAGSDVNAKCAAADAWFEVAITAARSRYPMINMTGVRKEWGGLSCDERISAMASGPVFINYLIAKYAIEGPGRALQDWFRDRVGSARVEVGPNGNGVEIGNESNGVSVSDSGGEVNVGGHKIASW